MSHTVPCFRCDREIEPQNICPVCNNLWRPASEKPCEGQWLHLLLSTEWSKAGQLGTFGYFADGNYYNAVSGKMIKASVLAWCPIIIPEGYQEYVKDECN